MREYVDLFIYVDYLVQTTVAGNQGKTAVLKVRDR
jgi:hypothetical protein